MPQIKKILFPVDFAYSCYGTARYVEAFAGRFQAEIMLVHAVGMGEHSLAEDLLPSRKARLDSFLAADLSYFPVQRVCVTGDPAEAIAGEAQSWKPDLVMMPTHGLGFFRRNLVGSVTSKVLHDLTCPVWTSVHAEAAPPLEEIHCRKVVCALDLGEHSEAVLCWAAGLAQEYQAELGVVYATGYIDQSDGGSLREGLSRQVSVEANARIDALQARAAAAASRVFVIPDSPSKAAARATRDFGADLLVIGRHAGRDLPGDLFQHAHSIIRDSPCPVVSV